MADKARLLRAMVFADIVGYSALIAEDEDAALDLVGEYIKLFEHFCTSNNGEIVQVRGDGVFALFPSAVNAVTAAVEAQETITEKNEDQARPIVFRVGVNLGDVLQTDTGIHGDAVNVAKRLESLADPGSVSVSGTVYGQVKNRLSYGYSYLGLKELKNVPEPVDVYFVHKDAAGAAMMTASPRIGASSGMLKRPDMPSVVILPFKNLSGDPADSWFSEGITDDITTNLSKFRNLFVIARNSAFQFKGPGVVPGMVGAQLGVRYVAQGSIRKAGTKVRVSVELVDAETDQILWAERYDRDMEYIFEVQDEIVNTVVAATAVHIEASERRRSAVAAPGSVHVYSLVLRGQQYGHRYQRFDNFHARELYEEAINVDGSFARAQAGYSRTLNIDWRYDWTGEADNALDDALKYAQNAVELDPTDARGFGELGFAHLYRKEHDSSLTAYERGLKLNPNDADLMSDMADAMAHSGNSTDAITLLKRAMELNPFYPDQYLWHLGGCYYNLKDYNQAIDAVKKMNNPAEGRRLLAACYGQLNMPDEARFHADKVMEAHPDFRLDHWAEVLPERLEEELDHYVEGLKKAGLK